MRSPNVMAIRRDTGTLSVTTLPSSSCSSGTMPVGESARKSFGLLARSMRTCSKGVFVSMSEIHARWANGQTPEFHSFTAVVASSSASIGPVRTAPSPPSCCCCTNKRRNLDLEIHSKNGVGLVQRKRNSEKNSSRAIYARGAASIFACYAPSPTNSVVLRRTLHARRTRSGVTVIRVRAVPGCRSVPTGSRQAQESLGLIVNHELHPDD